MNRTSILSLLLALGIVAVGMKTYLLWAEGPWEVWQSVKREAATAVVEEKKDASPVQLAMNTKSIIDNDLFDPDRGTGRNKETETVSLAVQKIRSMALLGTMIIGESRYAMLQKGSDPRLPSPASKNGNSILRLKLGDTIEGFQLSEIQDRSVVFSKGPTQVDISIDYFKKIQDTRRPTATSAAPVFSRPPTEVKADGQPLAPRLPRRAAR